LQISQKITKIAKDNIIFARGFIRDTLTSFFSFAVKVHCLLLLLLLSNRKVKCLWDAAVALSFSSDICKKAEITTNKKSPHKQKSSDTVLKS